MLADLLAEAAGLVEVDGAAMDDDVHGDESRKAASSASVIPSRRPGGAESMLQLR